MFDLIESILVKIFHCCRTLIPTIPLLSVNGAFATITPTIAKINLIFPVYTLFKNIAYGFVRGNDNISSPWF